MMCSRPVSIGIVPDCTLVVRKEVLQKVLTCNLDTWVWSVTICGKKDLVRWDSTFTVGIPMGKVESYLMNVGQLEKIMDVKCLQIHFEIS